jgi:2-polyprenyl-3-methyl-5-hydroxy-6-metoxy-1,4-benzoquinol methylase
MKNEFEEIYEANKWKAGKGYGSGEGSLFENAVPYVDFLQKFINENGIRSVIDIGCGDWQLSKHVNWDGLQYLGVDIVQNVIDSNKQEYSTKSIKFECANIGDLKHGPVDLIMIKDVLQHWSITSINQLLERLPKYRH